MRHIAAICAGLTLTGCAVGPDFRRPEPVVLSGTVNEPLGHAGIGDVQQASSADTAAPGAWWTALRSPKVDALVDQALRNNWSLASQEAALSRARASLAEVRGGDLPAINASGQMQHTRLGATVVGPNAFDTPAFSAYGAGITISYDLDVFGQRRRRVEQAAAQVDDARFQRDAAALMLAGNVALQAARIAAAEEQIEATNSIVAADVTTIKLTGQGSAAGAATRVGVLEAQSQLDRDRAQLPPLLRELAVARHALAILVGRSPTDWTPPDFCFADFTLPPSVPGTLPSVLARRRPDILAAEARLHASSASIGIADADLYPKFDLTAALSRQGLVGGPAAIVWNLVAGVTAPVFHGGSLRAAVRGAQADYRANFADYQQIVVEAMGQVSDALAGLAADADLLAEQQKARLSAERSLDLNRQGYSAGSIGLLDVLNAQRLVAHATVATDQATASRLTDTIQLFLALGIHPAYPEQQR